jgi:8-oxo-dGTP pyrophosphatase MutT (NUDIX family)
MKKISEITGNYSMTGLRRMQAPGNIRSGFQTKGSRGSIQDDLEFENHPNEQDEEALPKAVVALVMKGNKILAVSRGDDFANLNLPGGSVEMGEDPRDAIVRELWEETGIKAKEVFPVYTKVNNGYVVTTFKVASYTGELKPSWEGIPSWEEQSVFLRSQYGSYFKSMWKNLHGAALTESAGCKS